MKKILSLFLALILVVSITVPAYAYDGTSYSRSNLSLLSWWRYYDIGDPPGPYDPNPANLGVPKITQARYHHKSAVSLLSNQLQISWNAVDGAESYEVEVSKADGTTSVYTSTSTSLFLKNTGCPSVYVEKTATWVGATVRVRALAGNSTGDWSAASKIGCNSIH